MFQPLWLVSFGLGFIGLLLLLSALLSSGANNARRRRMDGALRTLLGLLLLAVGGLGVAIGIGMRGYQTLTREVTAAIVTVTPLGAQRYQADVTFADGRIRSFTLLGDELYIDAHILKWTPAANVLGLHTGYRLDRIAGRYTSVRDETLEPRTVYPLDEPAAVDLFASARRFAFLAPILDAEYGSGTFVPVAGGGTFLIRVSTSGLLVRRPPKDGAEQDAPAVPACPPPALRCSA